MLAICLQVCPHDVWLGLRLTKLICSIEPKKRNDIEFIVSSRRDTNAHAVNDIIIAAKSRFAVVRHIKGKRFGTGWPLGCNDLWQETMMRASMMRDARQLQADGILTFEADCLPLRPDWLDRLSEAWDKASKAGKIVTGHAHCWPLEEAPERAGEPGHINGNAIFDVLATDRFPALSGSDGRVGWDCWHSTLLLRHGLDTPMVFQKYRIKNILRAQVEAIRKDGQIPALFHGIKGTDGLDAVEAMVKNGSFFSRTDGDLRSCVVKAHTGGGLFSLINKVISAGLNYNGDIHVDWSENCAYGEPGRNAWNDLFEETDPLPEGVPFEVVTYYPEYSLTFRFAGALYTPSEKNVGWRERCHGIWTRLGVLEEIRADAAAFMAREIGSKKYVGAIIRAHVHGAEQPSRRSQELNEYVEAIDRTIKEGEKVFLMTSDMDTLNFFKAKYGESLVYNKDVARVQNRDSEELHTSGKCGIADAQLCLSEVLVMSEARAMIHPCSNMATAALYINPALVSVYLP